MDSGSPFRCPFCICSFASQHDLDLHLKEFGNEDHLRLWRCRHILLEEDGYIAGIDNHGDWHWSSRDLIRPSKILACRRMMSERAERMSEIAL